MTRSTKYLVPESIYTPNRPAIVYGNESFSYAQVFDAALGAETYLKGRGIQPGDRVGLLGPNAPNYLISILALWRIGAIACPLSTRSPDKLIAEQLQAIHCRYCLTAAGIVNIPHISNIDLSNIVLCHADIKDGSAGNFQCPLEQEATIIFTSGSSSKPKAVLHTFGNHFYSAKGSNEHIPVIPGDQWLLSLPLYHVGGLGILLRTFLGGGSIVIPDGNEKIEDALGQHKITHLSLVPTQLIRLLRNRGNIKYLKNLKAILLGGSPVPGSLIRASLEEGLPVYLTYGLTEMTSQVATSGRLTKGSICSAKILNYRRLMISEEEEILVKGETLFKGYIDGTQLSTPFNANGYFATSDLGTFSDDGHLLVIGRKDNMFISGGENIQPEEIEKHLCQLEGVEEAVVVPVAHDEFGFRPVAFIKSNEPLTRDSALVFLKGRLPSFKLPDQFYRWPAANNCEEFKVNRRDLIRLVEGQPAADLPYKVL